MARTILMTGATGFIGRALALRLIGAGYRLIACTRGTTRARDLLGPGVWLVDMSGDPDSDDELEEALAQADVVINLAGEPVMGGRWTARRREALTVSRVELTKRLVSAIGALPASLRPEALLSASAVGYYGDTDTWVDEDSEPGAGFLAELCGAWERAAMRASEHGLRVACLRIGLVLGHGGGVLETMGPLLERGLGGRLGSGRQFAPWIHLRDVVEVITTAIGDARYAGAINLTAPAPVTNAEFVETLAAAYGRSAPLPAPALALRVALGDAARVVLSGQRVAPSRLHALGFRFRYPSLEGAAEHLLGPGLLPTIRSLEGPAPDSPYLADRGARYELIHTSQVDAPPTEVFQFFSRAENLGPMTPRAMQFHIETQSPIEMRAGARIDYTIRLGAAPMRWRTEIATWEPVTRFVDTQLRGPYRAWWHEHRFEPAGDGTRMHDRVLYKTPLGIAGRVAHALYVAPMLRRIFAYRAQSIGLRFAAAGASGGARVAGGRARP